MDKKIKCIELDGLDFGNPKDIIEFKKLEDFEYMVQKQDVDFYYKVENYYYMIFEETSYRCKVK